MAETSSGSERIESLVTALLKLSFLEVHGLLRSINAPRLPPGWNDFSPTSKRRTLRGVISNLSADQVDELRADYVSDSDATPARGEQGADLPASQSTEVIHKYTTKGEAPSGTSTDDERSGMAQSETTNAPQPSPIFVVHGRDTAVESQTQLLIERTTGRRTIVLHEQVAGGRTVIEQIEQHAVTAAYAVVLLTGDDEGGLRGGQMRPRARQNVILELGYFWGHFGRGRVAVLTENDVELPSDAVGILYISIDPAGAWKTKLLQEVDGAGIAVDWSKLRA